jgi:hypothetical protein
MNFPCTTLKFSKYVSRVVSIKQNVYRGTDRQDGDIISLLFSFGKESRLKKKRTVFIYQVRQQQR